MSEKLFLQLFKALRHEGNTCEEMNVNKNEAYLVKKIFLSKTNQDCKKYHRKDLSKASDDKTRTYLCGSKTLETRLFEANFNIYYKQNDNGLLKMTSYSLKWFNNQKTHELYE